MLGAIRSVGAYQALLEQLKAHSPIAGLESAARCPAANFNRVVWGSESTHSLHHQPQ